MTLKTGNIVRWEPQFPNGWRTRGLSIGVTQEAAREHSLAVTTGTVVWYWSDSPTLPVIYYRGVEILPSTIIEWGDLQEEVNRLAARAGYGPRNEVEVEGVAAEVLLEAARKRLADFFETLGHPDPARGAGIQPQPSTSSASLAAADAPSPALPP